MSGVESNVPELIQYKRKKHKPKISTRGGEYREGFWVFYINESEKDFRHEPQLQMSLRTDDLAVHIWFEKNAKEYAKKFFDLYSLNILDNSGLIIEAFEKEMYGGRVYPINNVPYNSQEALKFIRSNNYDYKIGVSALIPKEKVISFGNQIEGVVAEKVKVMLPMFKKLVGLNDSGREEARERPRNIEVDSRKLALNKKQIILYGPPGTGKTYNTKEISVGIIEDTSSLFTNLRY